MKEVSVGDVDVDFDGGHSNISGSFSVKVCENGAGPLSAHDLGKIRAEFENIVRDRWLAIVFSCNLRPDTPAHLVAAHWEALKRMNTVLERSPLLDFACRRFGFSEAF
jgi:hypothetical protein